MWIVSGGYVPEPESFLQEGGAGDEASSLTVARGEMLVVTSATWHGVAPGSFLMGGGHVVRLQPSVCPDARRSSSAAGPETQTMPASLPSSRRL